MKNQPRLRSVFLFFLLLGFVPSKAQLHYDRIFFKDSASISFAKEKCNLLNLFSTGETDSLFSMLNHDTSIVSPDTLRKYYSIYKEKFFFPNSNNNLYLTRSDSSFKIERLYLGRDFGEAAFRMATKHERSSCKGLMVSASLFIKNGRCMISNITFHIQTVSPALINMLTGAESVEPLKLEWPEDENQTDMHNYYNNQLNKPLPPPEFPMPQQPSIPPIPH